MAMKIPRIGPTRVADPVRTREIGLDPDRQMSVRGLLHLDSYSAIVQVCHHWIAANLPYTNLNGCGAVIHFSRQRDTDLIGIQVQHVGKIVSHNNADPAWPKRIRPSSGWRVAGGCVGR